MQEVERHAEQQAEQHHRRAVRLGQPGRGERQRQGGQHSGIDRVEQRTTGEFSEPVRQGVRPDMQGCSVLHRNIGGHG